MSLAQRRALALEMYKAGDKTDYIFYVTRIHGGAVRQLAEAAGVETRRKRTAARNKKALKLLKKNVPISQLSLMLDMDPSLLYRMAKRHGLQPAKMTLEEKREARRQRKENRGEN